MHCKSRMKFNCVTENQSALDSGEIISIISFLKFNQTDTMSLLLLLFILIFYKISCEWIQISQAPRNFFGKIPLNSTLMMEIQDFDYYDDSIVQQDFVNSSEDEQIKMFDTNFNKNISRTTELRKNQNTESNVVKVNTTNNSFKYIMFQFPFKNILNFFMNFQKSFPIEIFGRIGKKFDFLENTKKVILIGIGLLIS